MSALYDKLLAEAAAERDRGTAQLSHTAWVANNQPERDAANAAWLRAQLEKHGAGPEGAR